MKQSKGLSQNNLVQILRTLSKEEMKEFEKFVASPYFNKGRNHLPLLKALSEYSPDYDSDKFTKESIYDKLFPGKEYKESVMKSMLSRLNDIAEEFILQISFEKNIHFLRERLFIREISERGLKQRAESAIANTEETFTGKQTGVLDNLSYKDFIDEVVNHHYNFSERSDVGEKIFQYRMYIVYAFLTEFLITEGSIYSQKNFWPKNLKVNDINEIAGLIDIDKILKWVRRKDPHKYEDLELFNLVRLAIQNPSNDEYYFKAKKLFFENMKKYDVDFKKFMMNCLSVLCTAKTTEGKSEFQLEAHNLRKKIYDENLFLFSKSKRLQSSEFRTAFIEALAVNQFEWAKEFAEQYADKVLPSLRKDIAYYVKANLSYHKRDYNEALNYANRIRINQITYKLDIRNLVSKVYYETGSIEPLFSYLDAYYKFLENSKSQNKTLLARHFNYIKFLRQLVKSKMNDAEYSEFMFLKDRINKENVSSKKWLLKKIEQIISGRQ